MLNLVYSIIAGLIQGATEFFPVSSSGHLLLFHHFFKFDFIDALSFDAALHGGTLLALIVFFWRDIVRYVKGFFLSFKHWNLSQDFNQRMAWLIILASVPSGLAGYFFEEQIKLFLRFPLMTALMLIIIAFFFFIFENLSQKSSVLDNLSWKDSLVIGLAQVLALIPGVSRSGITIIAGLGRKLKREAAARFSFLLGIPVILGASAKKMIDIFISGAGASDFLTLFLGLLAAFFSGYLAIKFLLRYLVRRSLAVFAVYRIALGLIIIYLILGLNL